MTLLRRDGLAIGGEIGELRNRMRLDLLAAASGRDVRRGSSVAQTPAEAQLLEAFREFPPSEAELVLEMMLARTSAKPPAH